MGDQAPGSGVTSRLGQVVAQNGSLQSLSAFNSTYSDSGLFGVYAVCEPAAAGIVVAEIKKAKAVLKGSLLRQVDDSAALMQDMGTQMLLSGKYATPAEFCAVVDGVSVSQVTAAAEKILSSKPTVVAFGDTHAIPHYSTIEAGLK